MTNLRWFDVPSHADSVEHALAMVAPFGVVLGTEVPSDTVFYYDAGSRRVMQVLGTLTVQGGTIAAHPRRGLPQRQIAHLIMCGEDAFHHPPSRRENWRLHRNKKGTWWATRISVPADLEHPAARACMAAHEEMVYPSQFIREQLAITTDDTSAVWS